MYRSSIVAFPNQRPIIPYPCEHCNLSQMKFSRNAEIRTAGFLAPLELFCGLTGQLGLLCFDSPSARKCVPSKVE